MNASTNDRVAQWRTDALASAVAQALRPVAAASRRHSKPYTSAVSAGAMLVLALSAAPAHKAGAQEQQGQGNGLEEITVTGSRILRRDFSANAPITTIDQTAFQAT